MDRWVIFDVNETLLDMEQVAPLFAEAFKRSDAMQRWFAGLLHASLVAAVMGSYRPFAELADNELEVLAATCDIVLTDSRRSELMGALRRLPAHADVSSGLRRLQNQGYKLVALTNSSQSMLEEQVHHAGLEAYFSVLLSVDRYRTFKPSPLAYLGAADDLGANATDCRFVAAHDWDVGGAMAVGMPSVFLNRGGRGYRRQYPQPICIGSVEDLPERLERVCVRD